MVSAIASLAATPKITDFGMATKVSQEHGHASGVQQGTPFYVSPEVSRSHQLCPASDVYAFGVIMWELMLGHAIYIRRCAPTPFTCVLLPSCCKRRARASWLRAFVCALLSCFRESARCDNAKERKHLCPQV